MSQAKRQRVPGEVFAALGGLMLLSVLWIWVGPLWPQSENVFKSAPKKSPAQRDTQTAEVAALNETSQARERLQAFEQQLAAQSKALDLQRERMATIESTARFIITIAAIFAALLGLAAWKTLEDQRRWAEISLGQQSKHAQQQIEFELKAIRTQADSAAKDLEQLRSEITEDFPMFGRMRRNFSRVLTELKTACANLRSQDDAYRFVSSEDRQRVRFYERAMAISVLLDTGESTREISDIFRYLGVFYASRYTVERMGADHPEAVPNHDDLYRARYYFDRAINLDPTNYLAYSHGGLFMMWYEDRELSQCSREWLRKAAEVGKTKQRPLLNLATLELSAFKNPDLALVALQQAAVCTEFEDAGCPAKPERVEYLRACALALKADRAEEAIEADLLYEKALESLRSISVPTDGWIASSLNVGDDVQGKPDRTQWFERLSAHPRFAKAFAEVTARLEG
jgi:hypothetical protein